MYTYYICRTDYFVFKQELPVRFANIMKEINLLPAALLQMPSVQELQVSKKREIFCFIDLHHVNRSHKTEVMTINFVKCHFHMHLWNNLLMGI